MSTPHLRRSLGFRTGTRERHRLDAERLNLLGVAMMALATAISGAILGWVLLTGRTSPDPLSVTLLFGLSLLTWLLIRMGRTTLAGWTFTMGTIGIIAWASAFVGGGVDSPAFAVYFLLVLTAGMMRGGGHAMAVAAVCIIVGFGLVVIETNGTMPSAGEVRPPLTHWIVYSGILIATAAYVGLVMRGLDVALSRARINQLGMEASADGMAIRHGQTLAYVNAAHAAMHGWGSADQLIGQPCSILFRPAEWARVRDEVLPEVRAKGTWRGEAVALRKDGSEFPIEMSLTRIDDERFVSVTRDISDRRVAERAMWRTQKLESLGVLAGGIAHDFNNLLTVMLGHLSLARMRVGDNESLLAPLDAAQSSAERAAVLTQQLLSYAGRTRMERRRLDLNRIVRDNAEILETAIPARVKLRCDLDAGPLPLDADPSGLQQTVMNLVLNASEAVPESSVSGLVQLSTARCRVPEDIPDSGVVFGRDHAKPGIYASLEITDNGTGMPQSVLERIFDPFFTTKRDGRGLGLSATLGIIREMRGILVVDSEQGRGSTFRLFLPLSTREPEEPGVAPHVTHELSGTALVVDDEPGVREAARAILRDAGMSVVSANDGEAGLRCLEHAVVDVVLLDLRMPRMDGEQALARIAALPKPPAVVVSSGDVDHATATRLGELGPVLVLPKPWDRDQLVAAVGRALLPSPERSSGENDSTETRTPSPVSDQDLTRDKPSDKDPDLASQIGHDGAPRLADGNGSSITDDGP